mgnify:CR=1 FL=1
MTTCPHNVVQSVPGAEFECRGCGEPLTLRQIVEVVRNLNDAHKEHGGEG